MGTDFLERIKRTIKRSWDGQRVALGTSDLLTRRPDAKGRSVVGEIIGGAKLYDGQKVTVEKDGKGLVARIGLTEVVRIADPPPGVVQGVEESCGVGVGVIDNVHGPAGVVEMTIC
ncbi:MAG TPA: hypothetical protein VGG11_02580 [Xanthobacteraceae bacterium]|jgi:hypothetical protein